MDENIKLPTGTEVIIDIPFTYAIGDENPITGEILETIADCRQAVIDEFDRGYLIGQDLLMRPRVEHLPRPV